MACETDQVDDELGIENDIETVGTENTGEEEIPPTSENNF